MGSHYCHLKLDERRKIDKWREAKMSIPEIADRLSRAPSTIYRELKRNTYEDKELPELNGYYCMTAQAKYEKRRAIHRKMILHPDLKAAIEDRLKAGWSPEQIAGRMRLERHPIRVSHETIYRFAYSKDGRDEQFYRHLPEHRVVADRVATADITGPTYSTCKACLTGLIASQSAPSSATGSAI